MEIYKDCKNCEHNVVPAPERCKSCQQLTITQEVEYVNWEEDRRTRITENLKNSQFVYTYCGLCGRTPGAKEEPNYSPLRWWDSDDGWRITALCRGCAYEMLYKKPKPTDFAYNHTNGVCDDENTDLDPSGAMYD